MRVPESGIVLFHVDPRGIVWVADDFDWGECTGVTVSQLLRDFPRLLGYTWKHVQSVRLLGVRRNAVLIHHLAEMQMRREFAHFRVMVANPRLCPKYNSWHPMRILGALRQPVHVWETYAFAPVTINAFIGYAVAALCDQDPPDNERIRLFAQKHPAWPALRYAWWGDLQAGIRVLTEILDIRWFVHNRPGRLSRLNQFFRLGEAARLLRQGRALPQRTELLWSWLWPASAATELARHPDRFPEFVREGMTCRNPRGPIRMFQRMLHLLYRVWLSTVTGSHPESAFDPHRFFRNNAEEARRYKELCV